MGEGKQAFCPPKVPPLGILHTGFSGIGTGRSRNGRAEGSRRALPFFSAHLVHSFSGGLRTDAVAFLLGPWFPVHWIPWMQRLLSAGNLGTGTVGRRIVVGFLRISDDGSAGFAVLFCLYRRLLPVLVVEKCTSDEVHWGPKVMTHRRTRASAQSMAEHAGGPGSDRAGALAAPVCEWPMVEHAHDHPFPFQLWVVPHPHSPSGTGRTPVVEWLSELSSVIVTGLAGQSPHAPACAIMLAMSSTTTTPTRWLLWPPITPPPTTPPFPGFLGLDSAPPDPRRPLARP